MAIVTKKCYKSNNSKIILLFEFILEDTDAANTAAHRFWDLNALQNNSITIDSVRRRKIPTTQASHYICGIVASKVLTTEGNDLMQRSFWP